MAHRISIIEECKQEIYAGLEITREEALALVDAPLVYKRQVLRTVNIVRRVRITIQTAKRLIRF